MESLNENEMKQVNEEILKTWRETGFLAGISEGSQIEWRVAKSMDLMSDYLSECNDRYHQLEEYNGRPGEGDGTMGWDFYAFPIIRRCINNTRPRVTKIITPHEFNYILTNNTIDDMFNVCEKYRKTHSHNSEIKFGYLRRYFMAEKTNGLYIIVLPNLMEEQSFNNLSFILDVDLVAEMVALMSLFISIKMNEK